MKNITWNKVKTTVKDWQVGDYIRQTSIVVIGVLITFVGSELVTQNSEKKDIQATMSLIRDELKSNRENYKSIVSEFREDERLSSLLVEHDLTYIIHSGFISGYQNRYGDNLKPPTNVYHRMTA